MICAAFDYLADVIVGEAVVYCLALAAEAHKACALENAELMGYGRLGNTEKLGHVLNAHLSLKENIEKLYSRCVSEYLVKLCKIV